VWKDPRGPDGVTILAPAEQFHASDFPGLRTGDPPAAGALFDLEADPGEERNLAAAQADEVKRLKALVGTGTGGLAGVDGCDALTNLGEKPFASSQSDKFASATGTMRRGVQMKKPA
jgi:hypothetical protein